MWSSLHVKDCMGSSLSSKPRTGWWERKGEKLSVCTGTWQHWKFGQYRRPWHRQMPCSALLPRGHVCHGWVKQSWLAVPSDVSLPLTASLGEHFKVHSSVFLGCLHSHPATCPNAAIAETPVTRFPPKVHVTLLETMVQGYDDVTCQIWKAGSVYGTEVTNYN